MLPGQLLRAEQVERVGGDGLDGQAAAPGDVLQQRLGQRLDVARALAQRRQADRQHVQPPVEVGAEAAVGDHRAEVAAGRGDDANVDALHRVAADRFDLLLLQHAQQLGLQGERHVADLVEEQRAAVGEPELAVAAAPLGAGIGAGGDAEELGFEQRVGNGGDVDADERPRRARAGGMDAVRQQLLAGTGLAEQQHRAVVGLRDAPRMALGFHRLRAAADEAGDGVLGAPLARAVVGELAPGGVELALQAAELDHQRLHRRLRMVEQHDAHRAHHLAGGVAQRQPADEKVPAGLVSRSTSIGRPLSTTCAISVLGTTSSTGRPTKSASTWPSAGRKRSR